MLGKCKSNLSQLSKNAQVMKVVRRQETTPQAELRRIEHAKRQGLYIYLSHATQKKMYWLKKKPEAQRRKTFRASETEDQKEAGLEAVRTHTAQVRTNKDTRGT
jgi:hypothetical protein